MTFQRPRESIASMIPIFFNKCWRMYLYHLLWYDLTVFSLAVCQEIPNLEYLIFLCIKLIKYFFQTLLMAMSLGFLILTLVMTSPMSSSANRDTWMVTATLAFLYRVTTQLTWRTITRVIPLLLDELYVRSSCKHGRKHVRKRGFPPIYACASVICQSYSSL